MLRILKIWFVVHAVQRCFGGTSATTDVREQVFYQELVEPANIRFTDDSHLHMSVILSNIKPENDGTVPKILKNLRLFSRSLLEHSEGTPLHIMFITDEKSKPQIQKVVHEEIGRHLSYHVINALFILTKDRKFPRSLKVEFVKLEVFSTKYKQEIEDMRTYFGITGEDYEEVYEDGSKMFFRHHTKYKQDLFYIGPMYHLEFPDEIKILMVLDVDLEFKIDLLELWNEHKNMKKGEVIGVGPELTRYYRIRTELFIQENPGTLVGQPGIWQGFNSGVALYNLENIRESQLFNQLINPEFYKMVTAKYVPGGLGDQDLFTMMGWEYPHLFYNLPCQYNYQTYRDIDSTQSSLEQDVKEDDPEYRNCKSQGKIIHLNGLIGHVD